MNNKKELAVAALRNGIVIDHIPSDVLFTVVKILGIQEAKGSVTIGYNLESRKIGKKGIIKVADADFDEATMNRIALIAPTAVVNVIREYEVATKHPVKLPDTFTNIVKCPNPKCVTNNEPMKTVFHLYRTEPVSVKCHYCNHVVTSAESQIL